MIRNSLFRGAVLIFVTVALFLGSVPAFAQSETPAGKDAAGADPLKLSMKIKESNGVALFQLDVTNTSQQKVLLDFATAQRYDFVVKETVTGNPIWKWSDDESFLPEGQTKTLNEGETWSFTEAWYYKETPPGDYQATGFVISKTPRQSDLVQCTFLLPIRLTLTMTESNGAAELAFEAKNTDTEPFTLKFGTDQQYDFVVKDKASEKVIWQWSSQRKFDGAPSEKILNPGDVLTFNEIWAYSGPKAIPSGEYFIQAILSSNPPIPSPAQDVPFLSKKGDKVSMDPSAGKDGDKGANTDVTVTEGGASPGADGSGDGAAGGGDEDSASAEGDEEDGAGGKGTSVSVGTTEGSGGGGSSGGGSSGGDGSSIDGSAGSSGDSVGSGSGSAGSGSGGSGSSGSGGGAEDPGAYDWGGTSGEGSGSGGSSGSGSSGGGSTGGNNGSDIDDMNGGSGSGDGFDFGSGGSSGSGSGSSGSGSGGSGSGSDGSGSDDEGGTFGGPVGGGSGSGSSGGGKGDGGSSGDGFDWGSGDGGSSSGGSSGGSGGFFPSDPDFDGGTVSGGGGSGKDDGFGSGDEGGSSDGGFGGDGGTGGSADGAESGGVMGWLDKIMTWGGKILDFFSLGRDFWDFFKDLFSGDDSYGDFGTGGGWGGGSGSTGTWGEDSSWGDSGSNGGYDWSGSGGPEQDTSASGKLSRIRQAIDGK